MKQISPLRSSLALLLALAPFSVVRAVPVQNAKIATTKSPSWIVVRASTDKARYVVGESIKFTLKATNIQSRDAYLKYSSGQRFELKLFKSGATESVYTWSANKNFMTVASHIKLKSGQSETYRDEIGKEMGELAPGTYRLQAQLSNSSQLVAPPINFVVAADDASAPQVTLSATTDKRIYKLYEKVQIDFALQNKSDAPVTFELSRWQTYDIVVRDAAGDIVWSWAGNISFSRWRSRNIARMQPLDKRIYQVTINAGEKKDFSDQWGGCVLEYEPVSSGIFSSNEFILVKYKPGKYTIEAIYAPLSPVRAAPVEIEIR